MTHDVATVDETPRAPRAPMMAGGRPHAIIPQSMDDAYRLGKAICLAGMAPKGMDSPEKCMIAIMRGMEVGLTPMQALDKIAIVNGRPTIWGDGALGLVRGSGLCEYVKEWIEGEGDAMVAFCEAKRRGEAEPVLRTFSVKEAKEAGLWGKAGPWQQFKRRMLAMRARAFCLRDLFADVLGGLYLKEELDNGEPDPRRAPSPSAAPTIEHRAEAPALRADMVVAETGEIVSQAERQPASAQTGRRAPSPSAAPAPQAKPAKTVQAAAQPTQHYDPERVRKRLAEALKASTTQDEINNAWDQIIDPWDSELMPPDREDFAGMCRMREGEISDDGAAP